MHVNAAIVYQNDIILRLAKHILKKRIETYFLQKQGAENLVLEKIWFA